MTRSGQLMSIDRYGINKNDIGTLAKASFEETEKILLKAAIFGEVDPVTGVSANVMMGQPIRGGTAFSQILLDDQMLYDLIQTTGVKEREYLEEKIEENIDYLHNNPIEEFDACAYNQFQTSMILPTASEYVEEPDIELIEI
jgi:hypothetical protein